MHKNFTEYDVHQQVQTGSSHSHQRPRNRKRLLEQFLLPREAREGLHEQVSEPGRPPDRAAGRNRQRVRPKI